MKLSANQIKFENLKERYTKAFLECNNAQIESITLDNKGWVCIKTGLNTYNRRLSTLEEMTLTLEKRCKISWSLKEELKKLPTAEIHINDSSKDIQEESNSENKLDEIRLVIKAHTDKLNTMKDNRAHADEFEWSECDWNECDAMIRTLASILSDLNKVINK